MTQATLMKVDVERLDHDLEAAFNRGDMASVAAFYAEDAQVMPPGGEAIRGRPAIEAFWRAAYEQLGIKEVTLTTQDVMSSEDIACEVGAATLRIESPGIQATDTIKYLVVWRRQADGAWRLAVDIWNSNTSA